MPKFPVVVELRNYGRPPEPSIQRPFAQLEWAFDQYAALKTNAATKQNYQSAKRLYIKILRAQGFKGPFILAEQWDQFAPIKLRESVEAFAENSTVGFSSYTRIGFFSATRCVMRLVCAKRLLHCNELVDVALPNATSETEGHTAYSDAEMIQLLDVMAEELEFARRVINGYRRPTDPTGRDPRQSPHRGAKNGFGYGNKDNMRWYFENVLDCKPIRTDQISSHHGFLAAASNVHGGLHHLYRSWNVSVVIGLDVVMPLVVQLSYLTGLNPFSLLTLRTDCYIEKHELTGTPYLRAWKLRSGGDYNLDLDLMDSDIEEHLAANGEIYDEDLRPLHNKQALQVERTVKLLLKATQDIRDNLPESSPLKQRLFIYTSLSNSSSGNVIALSPAQTSRWCRQIVLDYQLLSDAGGAMSFNLVKFRSTKLTEMARQGRDLVDIQIVASHKSIATTIGYIFRRKLEAAYVEAISAALIQIHQNRLEFSNPKPCSTTSSTTVKVYKGLLADCKNVFDPPARVRQSRSFVAGQSCSRFNMCLFCKNIIVFREHLPVLVSYLNQINSAQDNNIYNVPDAELYKKSKGVIEELLNPNHGEFSEEDIAWAKWRAENIDVLVDPLVFRGVQ